MLHCKVEGRTSLRRSVMACPARPALAVRPHRCTYVCTAANDHDDASQCSCAITNPDPLLFRFAAALGTGWDAQLIVTAYLCECGRIAGLTQCAHSPAHGSIMRECDGAKTGERWRFRHLGVHGGVVIDDGVHILHVHAARHGV